MATTLLSSRKPETLHERVEALERTCAALGAAIRQLQMARGPGPRDDADVALVLAIVTASKGLAFTAAGLWRHRTVDPDLAAALEAADIDDPRQLGKLFRRLEGRDISGYAILRTHVETTGRDRGSIRWQIRHAQE